MAESGDRRDDPEVKKDGGEEHVNLSRLSELSCQFIEKSKELQELVEIVKQEHCTQDGCRMLKELKQQVENLKQEKAKADECIKRKEEEIKKMKDEVEKLKKELAAKNNSTPITGASPLPRGVVLQAPLFCGMEKKDSLTSFVAKNLIPNDNFNSQVNEITNKLVQLLQQGPFRIKRIPKGGSLGKGTHVRNKSDIDLIIFFNEFKSVEELQKNKRELLTRLHSYITKEWSSENLLYKDRTPNSLQFYVKIDGHEGHTEVDLLPAVDIIHDEKNKRISREALSGIYQEMGSSKPGDLSAYSSCLFPLQVDFVKTVPGPVKDLMRILKYWAKEELEGIPISSYFFELLVIKQWREDGEPTKIKLDESLRRILVKLTCLEEMAIAFTDNYNYEDYKKHKPPFLLDPANPFRNVLSINKQLREQISRKASILLTRGWDI